MTADERHALIGLKIERANKHIKELEAAISSFRDSNPYKVATKRDTETQNLIYYVESAKPVPVKIAAIAGDAIHCLRDALDHLAQQLYRVGTGDAQGYRDATSFPIAMDPKKFKKGLARKIEGMRQDAVDAIRALEPYPGGKGADLWTLHRLNNIDKHRLILTVGSAFRSVDVAPIMGAMIDFSGKPIPRPALFIRPADNLFPLEAGKELLIVAPDAEPNEKIEFRFDVAVDETGLIEGKPIIETVQHFSDLVRSIADGFKTCLS
jgi:hypothetical protein